MDMMGYDIRVLGNHEFDNGMEELAKYWKPLKGRATSANYDFSNTALKGVFAPYIIKTIAGRKVGFFGLNVDPASLIAAKTLQASSSTTSSRRPTAQPLICATKSTATWWLP